MQVLDSVLFRQWDGELKNRLELLEGGSSQMTHGKVVWSPADSVISPHILTSYY